MSNSNVEFNKHYVLGFDPGSKNFAYSLIEVDMLSRGGKSTLTVNVIRTGLLNYTVTSASQARAQLAPFIASLSVMLYNNGNPVQRFGVEQYQNRGFGNKLTEIVNIMIGAILNEFQSLDIDIFPASSWKNRVNKLYDLKEAYKWITCTEHEVDATLIAVYKAFKSYNIEPYFGYKRGMFNSIVKQVEKASTTEVRKRKYKK